MTADRAALNGDDEGGYEQGWGHPEVDLGVLVLWVCQRATGLSMRWDMALNNNSPLLQSSGDMNQFHGSTAAGIKYQAGTGLSLLKHISFRRNWTKIHINELYVLMSHCTNTEHVLLVAFMDDRTLPVHMSKYHYDSLLMMAVIFLLFMQHFYQRIVLNCVLN